MGGKKIAVIGSGGREHALGESLAKSDEVAQVIYMPGNAGTASENKASNYLKSFIKPESFPDFLKFIQSEGIDLVVVGPEDPLNNGIVNYLNSQGYNRAFGPTKEATQLESDKFYSHDLMKELGILQAISTKCHSTAEAAEAIKHFHSEGIVIKARGLTAGKGVTVCDSKKEALEELTKHADAYGQEVLIAERLFGEEFSIFGISDGNRVLPIGISFQDHKPLLDGDKGPNTGGMGAYGPAPIAPLHVVNCVANKIMNPIVQRMKERGHEYKGFLYAGMMMTKDGPKVIEFNARFGDPECQPAMMMLKNGLYAPLSLALEGKLDEIKLEIKGGAACCVVLASQGYPGDYKKGLEIKGLAEVASMQNVKVFHAGTAFAGEDKKIVTAGGRVLGVTAYSADGIIDAKTTAYAAASKIAVEGGWAIRSDISDKATNR
ncbi:MAG: phosphoribosylamine--glycine ligase [Nanoarchaeota archaeon]|nr:phosphoribosylamine--glycine ligase [Nanoarchaeota archaeon]